MVEKITRNSKPKLLSLILAIALWFFVIYSENPEREVWVRNIPVSYTGVEALSSRSLVITESVETISVKVNSSRRDISEMDSSNVTAQANLESITTPGEFQIPVSVTFPIDNVSLADSRPYSITVVVDELTADARAVAVNLTGTPKDGFIAGTPEVSPEFINITGILSEFSNIKGAVATVDIDGADSDVTATVSVKLLSLNGEAYSHDAVSIVGDTVTVTVPILSVKSVPVSPVFGNQSDFMIENMSVSAESVEIKGAPEVIETVTSLSTQPIILTEGVSEYYAEIILPEGVSLVSEDGGITVTISFSE